MNTILPRFVEFNKNTTFNTEDMPYWIAISKINLCFACIAVILFFSGYFNLLSLCTCIS